MPEAIIVRLRTVTPLWTGDIDRQSEQVKETGIAGSLRWWYEVLVRGLGGYACDPTDDSRCHFDDNAYAATGNVADGLQDVCAACRLFGCTGWSSKLRILVRDGEGRTNPNLNQAGVDFQIEFFQMKPTEREERWLLSKAIWLMVTLGAMGGKTPLKPPAQPDYGLVRLTAPLKLPRLQREEVTAWLEGITAASPDIQRRAAATPPEWPNLRYFFFNNKAWLDVKGVNELVKVDPTHFLSGRRGVSKKVFSFQKGRLWGYTTGPQMLQKVLDKLEQLGITGTWTGEEVINEL